MINYATLGTLVFHHLPSVYLVIEEVVASPNLVKIVEGIIVNSDSLCIFRSFVPKNQSTIERYIVK